MPPKKCLIVDDQESVRGYLRAILEDEFQTVEAEDGIQGLRLVEKLGSELDLIVTDIQMPTGDGMTFACSVRESFPALPIVLVSGYVGSYERACRGTSFTFVKKPFPPEALLTAIASATSRCASSMASSATC
ncbi:Two component, sigma54 specific, transcriptional regulator, Fis family (fragment) [Candidatus Sulfopaludibacter sp. SbA3]